MSIFTIIDRLSETCTLRVPHTYDDGEGGRTTVYERGDDFIATISKVDPSRARKAEHDVPQTTYHVTVPIDVDGPYFGAVIEDSRGLTYKITSEAVRYPSTMGVQYARYDAERWDVPGEEVAP
jgi:hypothetical protein